MEAISDTPPIVGWVLLGLAHLRARNFAECEYYFRQVIAEGDALQAVGSRPTHVIGTRLDERLWPLALIRAWAHLGMAFSYVERDADLVKASHELATARRRATTIKRPDRFPTRIQAACTDCEAFIALRSGKVDEAIELFEAAVGEYPYSRSYIYLASAYKERACEGAYDRASDLAKARRALQHAVNLLPGDGPKEVQDALDEINALSGNAR